MWAVNQNGVLLGFKVIGKEIHDSDALETAVRQLTEADILAMSATGLDFYRIASIKFLLPGTSLRR